jgi:hypothetical protein
VSAGGGPRPIRQGEPTGINLHPPEAPYKGDTLARLIGVAVGLSLIVVIVGTIIGIWFKLFWIGWVLR